MKKIVALFILTIAATAVNAEVIHLKCEGKNSSGKAKIYDVSFSPDQGWSYDGVIRVTGAVKADSIIAFGIEIDRVTGSFIRGRDSSDQVTGYCSKVTERKVNVKF